jgi:DNA repair exonuclease SbcCD nuclease subunit
MKYAIMTDTHVGCSVNHNSAVINVIKDVEKQKPDILIISGDIVSHHIKQRTELFSYLRRVFPNIPILIVNGNHDYWNEENKSPQEMEAEFEEIDACYNILSLNGENDFLFHGVYICGAMLWYHEAEVGTQDYTYIPNYREGSYKYLVDKAHAEYAKCLARATAYKREIGLPTMLITHFPIVKAMINPKYKDKVYFGANPKYEEFLDSIDYVISGHYHTPFVGLASNGRTKAIMVGSDYEKPTYIMMEISIEKKDK